MTRARIPEAEIKNDNRIRQCNRMKELFCGRSRSQHWARSVRSATRHDTEAQWCRSTGCRACFPSGRLTPNRSNDLRADERNVDKIVTCLKLGYAIDIGFNTDRSSIR